MASRASGKKGTKSRKVLKSLNRQRHPYTPMAEQVRMCAEYMQGGPDNSVLKIAKRFKRDWETVQRIVKSEKMEAIAENMQRAILANSSEKIVERIDYEVATKKSKAGAWIAMDLAERIGAIPPKIARSMMWGAGRVVPSAATEKPEEERVKDWVMKLTEVTMERGRIFDMPMPELDELKEEEEIEIPLKGKREKVE